MGGMSCKHAVHASACILAGCRGHAMGPHLAVSLLGVSEYRPTSASSKCTSQLLSRPNAHSLHHAVSAGQIQSSAQSLRVLGQGIALPPALTVPGLQTSGTHCISQLLYRCLALSCMEIVFKEDMHPPHGNNPSDSNGHWSVDCSKVSMHAVTGIDSLDHFS